MKIEPVRVPKDPHHRKKYLQWILQDYDVQHLHPFEEAKKKYLKYAASCPRCNISVDQLSWFYLLSTEPPLIKAWLTICNLCNLPVNLVDLEAIRNFYSWGAINSVRNDKTLQNQYSPEDAKNKYLEYTLPCPICKTASEKLSWFYLDHHPLPSGWMIVCDNCNLEVDFFKEGDYSWKVVNAARYDNLLQNQHSTKEARDKYLRNAVACPICKVTADQLSWFYFRSPEQDWKSLAGRAGWMTVCDNCNTQVDFFVEISN